MGTPIDDALNEAQQTFIRDIEQISLTDSEREFVRWAAPKLNEAAIGLIGQFKGGSHLRGMVIAWALAQFLGPHDVLDRLN